MICSESDSNSMKIVYNNIIPAKGYKAIYLFGVVFARKGTTLNEVDVNHESIHTAQMKELLYVGFYLLYMAMFIWQFVKLRDCHKAYRAVPFEKEAYAHEKEKDYLKNRKRYNWINV